MTKQEWIEEAVKVLIANTGSWENEMEYEYCEGLYETYVEDNDLDHTSEEAVLESLTYWEE